VIVIATIIFAAKYKNIFELFKNKTASLITVLIITVLLVHLIKALRLYLILFDSNIDLLYYLKVYCKVTPVSIVVPFKLGELFRMYCYGKALGNILKGAIIVLFDRFIDTIALVTLVILVQVFNGGHMTSFLYLLLIFLIVALLCYFLFPNIYKFWKRYFLRAKATNKKLDILKFMDTSNKIYCEIENVVKGRGAILYMLSLAAWGVEIGSITILYGLLKQGELSRITSQYLLSAVNGASSDDLKQFVFISVLFMIIVYLFLKLMSIFTRKRNDK
jgi:hypothetical protein